MSPLSKKIVALKAELIFGEMICEGLIESISGNSVYFLSGPTRLSTKFHPGTDLKLILFPPSDFPVQMDGTVRWSYKTPPHGFTNSVGIEINNPPTEYTNILDTLPPLHKSATLYSKERLD